MLSVASQFGVVPWRHPRPLGLPTRADHYARHLWEPHQLLHQTITKSRLEGGG
jgi:hypothetical protein